MFRLTNYPTNKQVFAHFAGSWVVDSKDAVCRYRTTMGIKQTVLRKCVAVLAQPLLFRRPSNLAPTVQVRLQGTDSVPQSGQVHFVSHLGRVRQLLINSLAGDLPALSAMKALFQIFRIRCSPVPRHFLSTLLNRINWLSARKNEKTKEFSVSSIREITRDYGRRRPTASLRNT